MYILVIGSGAGGLGAAAPPPDFGKNMDLFDFVIMNLTFFRFSPPPILEFSGPPWCSYNFISSRYTLWRQRLVPYCVVWPGLRLGASVSRGTVPLPRWPLRNPGSGCCWSHSWCIVHAPLHVVPGAWPRTSLHPQGLCFLLFCVFSVYSGYGPGF